MSNLTYIHLPGRYGQVARVAAGRDKDATVIARRPRRGGRVAAAIAGRRQARCAAFATDARDRCSLPEVRIVWTKARRGGSSIDAIVIVGVFSEKTRQTPKQVIVDCRRRLRQYDELTR
jgi:hypothetical protein